MKNHYFNHILSVIIKKLCEKDTISNVFFWNSKKAICKKKNILPSQEEVEANHS